MYKESSTKIIASVIIVNYNGHHFLPACLKSLFEIDFPKNQFEVIIVDNNSKDDSVTYIKKNFPHVKLIESQENLGFTGGNNLGYSHATGEYIVLLNSDTIVDRQWLNALIKEAQTASVGLVTSKLMFATPFLRLHIDADITNWSEINNSTNFTPVGLRLESFLLSSVENQELIWYEHGFYPEKHKQGMWLRENASLLIPLPNKSTRIQFNLHGLPLHDDRDNIVTIRCGNTVVYSGNVPSRKIQQVKLTFDRSEWENKSVWLVQNAGNIIMKSGLCKDRGSVLRLTKNERLEFYDIDRVSYQKSQSVPAICGASCLVKRALIEHIGFFDARYYMYYEDIDLSLRAWQMGWDIRYAPDSIVYHHHRGSTGKSESSFFISMVERNHLMLLLVHFPLSTFFLQLFIFLIRTTVTVIKAEIFRFKDNLIRFETWKTKERGRLEALSFIATHFFSILNTRIFWRKRLLRSYSKLEEHLY